MPTDEVGLPTMRVILEARTIGSQNGVICLTAGQPARFGRSSKADYAFPDDSLMSAVHFVVQCNANECRIRDNNSSNGTFLNGKRVDAAVLQDFDEIVAGETRFLVRIETEEAIAPAAVETPGDGAAAPEELKPEDRVLALLREDFQPLYAVLDAARSPSVLKFLVESKNESESQSLYEGQEGAALIHFAPHLVRLNPDSALLEKVVLRGWGKSWGVFLTCDLALKELRRHFRHFLMARLPDGRQVYFRFYDPRVLRVYLPTCLPEEIDQLFGPVRYYLTEDEKPETLLRFSNAGKGVGLRKFHLAPDADAKSGAPSVR